MKRFILKVDDFRLNDSLSKFDRLIQLCERHAVPMSIGVIGAGLKGGRFRLQELFSSRCRSGQIELWNHSFSHKDMTQQSDTEVAWELATTTSLSERLLGHRPRGFGAPFNKCDERVADIASNQGLEFTYETAFSSTQVLTPEYNVPLDGQPNLTEFIKRVTRKAQLETLIVQVHPGRWLSRGFEQMAECFTWLHQAGYEPTTAAAALGLGSGPAGNSKPTGAHQLMVANLADFWTERSPQYDAELANFSSYFLGRFKANSLGIARLLEELDADLAPRTVVDVGCGLAQWSLPFFEFSREATVWAFDTNQVLSGALQDAQTAKLIPYEFRVVGEDYTSTTKLAKNSADRLVCANALNYIPTLEFARQSQHACRDGGQLILLNQSGAFNHLGVVDALKSSNASTAKERGLCALRQELVRLGFTGFMPARTTPSSQELEAVFYAFGFQLSDDFSPAWERRFRDQATFEGLVLARHHWTEIAALPPAFRPEYRKLICQAGFPALDDDLFPNDQADLKAPELGRLKARSGHERADELDSTLAQDLELGRLVRARAFLRASELVKRSAEENSDWLLAGAVAALIEGDGPGAQELARRLSSQALPEETRGLLTTMCQLHSGDMAGALHTMTSAAPV